MPLVIALNNRPSDTSRFYNVAGQLFCHTITRSLLRGSSLRLAFSINPLSRVKNFILPHLSMWLSSHNGN